MQLSAAAGVEPGDPPAGRRVVQRALELGVRVFDTAWYYGPDVANRALADATNDHRGDIVIATKLGWDFDGRGRLVPAPSPEQLRAGMARDLSTFGSDSIAIVHLRWTDDRDVSTSFRRALAAMIEMQQEGGFGHIGLSNVGPAQLDHALTRTAIASVSNSFSVADQADRSVLELTARHGIAYLPWLPLRTGGSAQSRALAAWARRLRVPPSRVALAWLLRRSPNIVPIPGTSSLAHLEDNVAALRTALPDAAMRELTAP
jgi:aryl-alcohol dehydrogenase-like predicted oxidoreductase